MHRDMKACIFDLDGVIVRTDHCHFVAWKKIADQLNILFTEKSNQSLRGVSRQNSLEMILSMGNMTLGAEEKEECLAKKNSYYLAQIDTLNTSDILPGALDLLRDLKTHGIKLGIASSSKNAHHILHKIGLFDQFDEVVSGNDIANAKPNEEIFVKMAEKINVPPSCCMVFEDAVSGIEAAQNAGMMAIGVGKSDHLVGCNIQVPDLCELNFEILAEYLDTYQYD